MATAIAERRVRFLGPRSERGQAMVEYALILVLVVIVVLVILVIMGNTVKNMFCNIAGSLNN
jgi:pilus assembly protein Flp/PilA